MSVARKKVLPMVLPTPPAAIPATIAPAPITATSSVLSPAAHPPPTTTTTPTTTQVVPHIPTTTATAPTTTNIPIQPAPPQLVPIKPIQPMPAQLVATQKIQPAPALHTLPKPIQPNTTATTATSIQSTYQTMQTMNFQVNGTPQTIAPSQLLPSTALSTQTPQTQKQLRTQKSKTQQAQATAQKPRKQKQTKRAVKRSPPLATTAQPILPRPAKGRTKITAEEIQLVQSLIERCLQLYMNQTEVITALHLQANIEPSFTSLVWLKLEEQNPDFFKAYHVRLRIKEQITAFNYLVSQQAQLMQKAGTFLPAAGLNQGSNAGTQMGLQTSGSPLVGSPQNMTYGLPPYAPLPQLPSLQALATQTASLTSSHPPPIAPRVPQAGTRNPTLSPQQTNGLLTPTATPFVAPMTDAMTYNFTTPTQTPTFSAEELKDDTPITEDIDTNQFFLSES